MITKTIIPGPVIFRKQHDAIITVKRNKATSTIRWTIGEIDGCGPASDAISQRCEASGMKDEVSRWWYGMKRKPSYGAFGSRWGYITKVPNDATDSLVAIISKHWEAAFVDLPLHYEFEGEAARRFDSQTKVAAATRP